MSRLTRCGRRANETQVHALYREDAVRLCPLDLHPARESDGRRVLRDGAGAAVPGVRAGADGGDAVSNKGTAHFQYRCRRCGEIEENPHTAESNGQNCLMEALYGFPSGLRGMPLQLLGIHCCKDGGMGVSDLIGFSVTP